MLVITGVLLVGEVFSQAEPDDDYNVALIIGGNDFIAYTEDPLPDVCPSIAGTPSIDTFRVELNDADPGAYYFEWVVYGGTIIWDNGVSSPANEANAPQEVGGVPYFYLSNDHYDYYGPTSSHSVIAVQWHTSDVETAWVAVRMHSEWGCTNGGWNVLEQDVYNQSPAFSDFPTDITIAYSDRLGFVLPAPDASDADACPLSLSYSLTVEFDGSVIHSGSDILEATRTLDLRVGDNLVTWNITDGMKSAQESYTIRVDTLPIITHIAWTNPTCRGSNNGTLYVSDTLSYFYGEWLEYALAGPVDTVFQTSRFFSGLSAGDTTLFARVQYIVDKDNNGTPETTNQLSEPYTLTLHNPASQPVDDIPVQGDLSVTITPATCASDSDGYVFVDPASMIPQNASLTFNGTTDHLKLNRTMSNTSAFT
ncbi:MAG TPA: hypothetical protein PLK12_17870, partial [Prolixibacteraceae bacterium]|nr:hypothetical protein [Prolixibacteraceae bacterium]